MFKLNEKFQNSSVLCKKGGEKVSQTNSFSYKASKRSTLNPVLEKAYYVLDLLPKTATPLIFLLTDSNLNLSNLGDYNNILMRFNRIDVNIHIIDLHSNNLNYDLYSLG